ncbi:MAG: glycosyltransferase [Myxococcota bacterium]|nr:glycosyltransferase [Myxococcota bacterium]
MDAQSPRVSVLMPIRNVSETLAETLTSIACQTYHDFEIVLVDDGSCDGSVLLARKLWLGSQTLQIERFDESRGIVSALNRGLSIANGEFIARMDGDDIMFPERLASQVDWLDNHADHAIVGSRIETFTDSTITEGTQRYEHWLNGLILHEDLSREIFVESPLAHPSVMFRKDSIQALGGYEDHGWPEDYDLWLRAYLAGLRFGKVDELLLRWRDSPNRASRVQGMYSAQAFMKCRLHYLCLGPLNGIDELLIWGAGTGGTKVAQVLEKKAKRIVAFVDISPRKIGGVKRGVPIIHMDELSKYQGFPILAAVGNWGARELIRDALNEMNYIEAKDYWCIA